EKILGAEKTIEGAIVEGDFDALLLLSADDARAFLHVAEASVGRVHDGMSLRREQKVRLRQIRTVLPHQSIQGSSRSERRRSNVVNRARCFTRSAPARSRCILFSVWATTRI